MNNLVAQSLAAPSIMAPWHVFGISSNWRNHVHFVNDHRIIYPAGHNLVVHNIDDKQQTYISGVDGFRGFTSLVMSPLKKFVAFGERSDKATVFIYDTLRLTKKKMYVFQNAENSEVIALSFLPGQENKFIACVTSAPDSTLYILQWSSSKILGQFKLGDSQVTEINFNRKDPRFLTVLGPQTFRCFQVLESEVKLVAQGIAGLDHDPSRVFTTHTSLHDGKVVVCTQKGEVFLLTSEGDYIESLHDPTGNPWYIDSILAYTKGFIVGGEVLTLHLYDAVHDGENTTYQRGRTIATKDVLDPKESRITSLSIVDSLENKLLCCTFNNAVYTVSLSSAAELSEEYAFEPLMEAFHNGAITGMDVCVRKPLIITCSTDRSVKIWNFRDLTLEYNKVFLEEAFAVSIHPSGFHAIVAFPDRIKMLNIGVNNHWYEESAQNKEYARVKGCRLLQFSRGGQFFAAVSGNAQNNQLIHIFATYTGQSLGYAPLKGHYGKIKCLNWSKDDMYLVSCGQDGITNVWRVSDGSRKLDFPAKGNAMLSVVLLDDNKTVLGVGNDRTLKKMADNFVENIDAHATFGQIALTGSNKLLFAGVSEENNSSGYIRAYKLPVLGTHVSEHAAHDDQGVSILKVTHDDQFVLSAGKDGILAVFEIKDKDARALRIREGFSGYSEEYLVTKKDVDDLKGYCETQKTKVNEKKSEPTPPAIIEREERIKQLKEQQKVLVENENLKYTNLETQLKESEQKYYDYIDQKKKEYEREIGELESHYHDITIKKVTTIEKEKKEQEMGREYYRKDISEMIKKHNLKVKDIEDAFAQLIEEEITQKNGVVEGKEKTQNMNRAMEDQIKEEIKTELETLKVKNTKEVDLIEDKSSKAKGDVLTAKRRYENLRREEAELAEKEKEKMLEEEELKHQKVDLKAALERQKEIINAKDEIISDKEKRIYELKKRTQELEKFKAVLDFKIKELKKDIGPREEGIAKMKIETNNLDKTLKALSTYNNTLGLVVDELDQKQTELQNYIKLQRNKIGCQNSKIKGIKDTVYKTVQHILDYDQLREDVLSMKEEYAKTVTKTADMDQDILAEYLAQRKYLEKSVETLKQNLHRDQVMHKKDNYTIMKENVKLISQINRLRSELNSIEESDKTNENAKDASKVSQLKAWNIGISQPNLLSEETLKMLMEKKKIIDHQKLQMKLIKEKMQELQTQREQTIPA